MKSILKPTRSVYIGKWLQMKHADFARIDVSLKLEIELVGP